ncbi:hypothetical protein C8P68_10836 [Mucilaginibacter yixingensis]|uniref:WG repeat protein n=1 Tax=Mucilaginibacter yixingensis TaxID=1295612 RepID=A0A2T5J5P8_9SPHI|nr:hypothetical protein [Mucilaginibacter yixingensis]PTQ93574.1 hypothetical protein C8P68_10836 [Mucilaginibacter yixingensis]
MNENQFVFSNGYTLTFDHPVGQHLIVDDVIIIRLTIPPKEKYDQNVFAFSTSGDFLWRIPRVPLFYEGDDCPYIGLDNHKNGHITLFNWCDTAVIVDAQTGQIIDKYNSK